MKRRAPLAGRPSLPASLFVGAEVLVLAFQHGLASDQTDVTQRLNALVQRGSDYSKVYVGGGTGVLVRHPFDGYESDSRKQVVPATFLHNDIFAGNKVFPGFGDHKIDFDNPAMLYVVGSNMERMFYDFGNIQSSTWGWGVLYPWDSNSVDERCFWMQSLSLYDCPGYAIPWGLSPTPWSANTGAGGFPAGNPEADSKLGGGAGCHFSGAPYGCHDPVPCTNNIDQVNRAPINLVQDRHCQCNYAFNDDWSHWVRSLGQISGVLPEAAMCWVNNIRDMIRLQNALWWDRTIWFKPDQPAGPINYWGWNEVPAPKQEMTNPGNWDAVMIKMPLFVCGGDGGHDSLRCLSGSAALSLEANIDKWVQAHYLVPGANNMRNRPGSYVVLHREWQDSTGNFFNWFFCEYWKSPNNKYVIMFNPASNGDPGYCYVDWGHSGFANSTVVV